MRYGELPPHIALPVVILSVVILVLLGPQVFGTGESSLSRWSSATAGDADEAEGNALTGVAALIGRGDTTVEAERPSGSPVRGPGVVMTQGYGVGTHAPAAAWGAIDLAVDGNGDGVADPQGSIGAPIYATHSGVVTVTPNSHPAGNHVWVGNDRYRTGYSHLLDFAVESGQTVERGDLLGRMGSTGMSSGPHLDYQVWAMEDGRWVNHNPLEFDAHK